MAYVHQTPLGMRRPKRKNMSGGASQGRAKAWYEICCPCGFRQRTAVDRKTERCSKCHKMIPGPWS